MNSDDETRSLQLLWQEGTDVFEFKSSGSTGTPKKIFATRKQLEASAKRTLEYLKIDIGIIVNCLNNKHIGGAMQVIRSLVGNLDLLELKPSKNPFNNEKINWRNISLLSLVPYQPVSYTHLTLPTIA